MSYIDKVNAFERWLETNYLPASSQLLWYKLLMLFNRCGWAEWVTVDNWRLMSLMQISNEKTFIKTRDNLLEARLIEYQKGTKGRPNKYRLVNLPILSTVNSTVNSIVDNTVNSIVDNTVNSIVDNTVNSTVINRLRLDKDKDKNIGSIASMNEDTPEVVTSRKKVVSIVPYEKIVDLYNSICISLNPVKQLTEKRKQTIGARYRENNYSLEIFETVFKNAQDSDFLKGGGTKGWQADFDWLLKPTNFVKVIEGKYNNTDKKQIGVPQETNCTNSEGDKKDVPKPNYGIIL